MECIVQALFLNVGKTLIVQPDWLARATKETGDEDAEIDLDAAHESLLLECAVPAERPNLRRFGDVAVVDLVVVPIDVARAHVALWKDESLVVPLNYGKRRANDVVVLPTLWDPRTVVGVVVSDVGALDLRTNARMGYDFDHAKYQHVFRFRAAPVLDPAEVKRRKNEMARRRAAAGKAGEEYSE